MPATLVAAAEGLEEVRGKIEDAIDTLGYAAASAGDHSPHLEDVIDQVRRKAEAASDEVARLIATVGDAAS